MGFHLTEQITDTATETSGVASRRRSASGRLSRQKNRIGAQSCWVVLSTKYLDEETGFYYYGYRYYSPELGRFISRDPVSDSSFQIIRNLTSRIMENDYLFVNNASINKTEYLGLWIVCCRKVNTEKGDPLLTGLFLPLIQHCQLEETTCPPFRGGNGELAEWTIHPASISKTGEMDNGCKCSSATEDDIRSCRKRHPEGGLGVVGDNCQTSVISALGNCCLKSSWVPNWYAGPTEGVCLEWGEWDVVRQIGMVAVVEKERYCKRFERFPIYKP